MEMVLSWVKSGLVFTIFASVIMMLSPNRSYMKHISLVIGMLFILVMLHPIMEMLDVDDMAYTSYIEHFFEIDEMQEDMSQEHIQLYEESVNMQLMAELEENGYKTVQVVTHANEEGDITQVHITFKGDVVGLERIDGYLKELFGQEVAIYYETGE